MIMPNGISGLLVKLPVHKLIGPRQFEEVEGKQTPVQAPVTGPASRSPLETVCQQTTSHSRDSCAIFEHKLTPLIMTAYTHELEFIHNRQEQRHGLNTILLLTDLSLFCLNSV
jgi:hypothetical protein